MDNELQKALIEAIEIIVSERFKNMPYDYTLQGKVVSISSDLKTCTVELFGQPLPCKVRSGAVIAVGDIALVTIPSGDFNERMVDGKLGAIGESVGGGDPVVAETTYTHEQPVPSASWIIAHNLGRFPSATVVDSAGSVVIGEVLYNSSNQITITFSAAFAGKAYLN